MTIKEFFSFQQNKYFWVNLISMAVVVIVVLFGVLKGLDVYTHHGEAVVVPDVKGMSQEAAEKMFRNRGLDCVVSDSSYVKTLPAGCVLEYNPSAGQKVKEGRTIYLTINALDIPLITVPDVSDNSSVRQAEARMLASGFRLGDIQYVSGEKDWVYGVKYKGRQLRTGDKVPTGAILTLMVGNGGAMPEETDSLNVETATEDQQVPASSDESASDESWF